MSSEERQRELREAGSEPAEAEKQESAKAGKEAQGKERAAEKAAASSARTEADAPADEESGRPKTPRRRRRKTEETKQEGAEEAPRGRRRKPAAEAEEAKPEGAEGAPRRRRRKPAAEQAEEAKQEAAETEAEAEAAEAEGEPEPEDEQAKPKRPPRRGAEVVAGTTRRAAPRGPDGAVTVRARARYVRCAPRKARLVIDHIRGKPVDEARAILTHTPRAAARDVLKLLDSAVANAENNHELVADELTVGKAYVDEGPTLKRYRPRALGRATRIRKRTSHMTIELTHKE
jgi:ribosomal protein L22